MISTFEQVGLDPRILEAVDWVNEQQKLVLQQKIEQHFNHQLRGLTVAVWGLAFKPKTDDIREAPALVLIDRLLELGATVQVHDPEAMENVAKNYQGRIHLAPQPLDALDGADALAICTEWAEFRNPDFQEMLARMKGNVIFDGRNLYDPQRVSQAGFVYHSIGRQTITPTTV